MKFDSSVELEIERCRDYAHARGWNVAMVYRACRMSPAPERPTTVHERMMKDALVGRFTRLIVEYPDRLGLDLDGISQLVGCLRGADVTVACVEEDAFSRSLFDRLARGQTAIR